MARPKSSKSIAADIDRTYREAIRLIEESMAGLHKQSRAYLDRITARTKLYQQWREERISRGVDVRDIGMTFKPKFDFVATVDDKFTPPTAARKAFEDALDAEFPSTAAVPVVPKKPKTKGTK